MTVLPLLLLAASARAALTPPPASDDYRVSTAATSGSAAPFRPMAGAWSGRVVCGTLRGRLHVDIAVGQDSARIDYRLETEDPRRSGLSAVFSLLPAPTGAGFLSSDQSGRTPALRFTPDGRRLRVRSEKRAGPSAPDASPAGLSGALLFDRDRRSASIHMRLGAGEGGGTCLGTLRREGPTT